MPRGGYRPNAGRPPGSMDRGPRKGTATRFEGKLEPLDYLKQVMRDPDATPLRRDRAAIALMPYCHARPVEAYMGKKEQLQRAAEAVGGPGSQWEGLVDQHKSPKLDPTDWGSDLNDPPAH